MSLSATLVTGGAPRPNLFIRALLAAPILGHLLRAMDDDVNIIFYILIIALTLLVLAMKTWGLVALSFAALCLVPVMFAIIIWITLP